jgi:glycosyltransferase involved in cell wall biosynthesis
MRSAQHVVTLSNVMKAEIESRGVPEDRVTIVPNAVDETYFTPGPQPPQLRIDCSLPPDTPIIGYIGSIVDYEGLPLLLHAVRKLRDSGLRFHFLCVGDGPELTGLMKTAANLNIRENVTFTGPVSHAQTLSYYRLLDLFVIPRRDLPVCRLVTPLKPVEAMACGIPVVTSHLPPLVELTGEGAAGPSFKAGSVEHLALALERLVGDQALRHAHAAQVAEPKQPCDGRG